MSSADPSFFGRLFGKNRTQRGSSNKSSIENLKTLAFVVPLTVMIWIYAENAQTRPPEEMSVRVQFVTSNANNAAKVPGAGIEGPELKLSMEGTLGQVNKFKEMIATNTTDGVLRLALPGNNDLGNKSVNIVDAFRNDPKFYGSASVKLKSTPSDLPVTVEPILPIDVSVAKPEGLNVTLQNVTFNPPRVRVTGPQSAVRDEFPGDNPTISIDTSDLDTSPSTTSRTKLVSLLPPKNSRIKVNPQKVEITYEVGSMIREDKIDRVFIDIRRPAADEGRYRVVINGGPVIFNVNVTGPSSAVSRLVGPNAVPVKAVLEVSRDDVDKGQLTRRVTPDFSAVDPTNSIRQIGESEVSFEVKSVAPGDGDRP